MEAVASILGSLGGGLASGGLGALFGLFGSIATWVGKWVIAKQEYKVLVETNKHDLEVLTLETNSAEKRAEIRLKETEEEQGGKDLRASIRADKAAYFGNMAQYLEGSGWGRACLGIVAILFGLVDFLRGLIRPGTTIVFMVWAMMISIQVYTMATAPNADQASVALWQDIINRVFFNLTMCLSWWYGNRKLGMKIR